MKPEFFNRFSKKNTQIQNFEIICPLGDELFHTGGQTDRTKLIVASRHFANAPKNGVQLQKSTILFLPVITQAKNIYVLHDISKIKLRSSYTRVMEFFTDGLRELYTKL